MGAFFYLPYANAKKAASMIKFAYGKLHFLQNSQRRSAGA